MSIKYCIPTSFDEKIIDEIVKINNCSKNTVYEFFGSTKESLTGSGRPSKILPETNIQKLEKHIKKCHSHNIKFNYLLNGACMGGKEFDEKYLKKILDFVKILDSINVDILTISNPYLICVIKNKFPKLDICLSIIAGAGSIQEIKIYEDMGVKRIVLDANMNRNFKLLEDIRKSTNIELEILANNPCLFKCPFRRYHPEIDSHISMKEKNIPIFPSVLCKKIRLQNMEEIIKSPWIRPSDAHHYSEVGIDFVKLGGRGKSTEWIINLAQHYIKENDGENFYQFIEKNGWEFFKNGDKKLNNLEVSIPFLPKNFINFFKNKKFSCGNDCEKCGYCKTISEKYIKINNQLLRKDYLKNIESIIKKCFSPF